MADATVVQVDIEPEVRDSFRQVLRQVPMQTNIGQLVGLCFDAGVRAERERAGRVDDVGDAARWREFSPQWDRSLNRRAEIEQLMFDAARGKRPMPTADELRKWALGLGTPDEVALRTAVAAKEEPGGYVTLPERVEELIARYGVRGLARRLGVDPGYISRMRTGERHNPVDELLAKLGLRRVVLYERIEGPA
jgi:hypothetical protein